MTLSRPWTRVFLDQCAIAVGATVLTLLFVGSQQAASLGAGATLITVNMGLLGWAWTRIMDKKSVALAATVIVIKYAFFVALLVWLAAQSWVQGLWLMAGVITFVPTTLIFAYRERDL
jgi:hypothetical protein